MTPLATLIQSIHPTIPTTGAMTIAQLGPRDISARGWFDNPEYAAAYVLSRRVDAAALMSEMQWQPGPTSGTLQCRLYGHSILWDISGDHLHAGHTDYEVMPARSSEIECGDLQQVLAFILALNW